MQASVHTFDPDSGAGSVLRDDGTVLPFEPIAWSASGLRHLRVGQRVCIRLFDENEGPEHKETSASTPPRVKALFIAGVGDGQPIG